MHLTKQEYLAPLSETVRNTSFTDSKGSGTDSALLGPPTVEFAPYGRVPTGKSRKDARQGTIDQEQDFIDFLQELTNPIAKPTPVDVTADKAAKAEEKIVTPLIQFIRDKKANKGKQEAAAKSSKHGRQESKDSKNNVVSDKKSAKAKEVLVEKKGPNAKSEKPTREAVKVLNKQSAAKAAPPHPPTGPAAASVPAASTQSSSKPERRRERGNAAAAAKILQRDLGLNESPAARRRRENSAAATAQNIPTSLKEQVTKAANGSNGTAPAVSTASTAPLTTTANPPSAPKATLAPTGPAASRNQQKQPQAPILPKSPQPSSITPTATQAFLKHANPSQGVTEPLLSEAFAPFGKVARVEIDKKKGFAYIDFAEPEGLQKAIAASPIKVAQGQVVVLERKTGASLQNRNMKGGLPIGPSRGGAAAARGGRGRGRGGPGVGKPIAPSPAPAAAPSPAASTAAAPAEQGPPP